MLGTFTHNFKSNCRAVTCECHGEFRTLTFSVNKRRQSAWIGLQRKVSTKLKVRQPISTSGWLVDLHKSSQSVGAEHSVAERVRRWTGSKAVGPRSPTVDRQGCPLFVDKAQKTQSPRGLDPRWPSLFERFLSFEEGVGAHSEPSTVCRPYYTDYKRF